MNVSKGSQRVVLQPETPGEAGFLRGLSQSVAAESEGVAWWTLDTPEYPALEEREPGALGEKALVLSWGGVGEPEKGLIGVASKPGGFVPSSSRLELDFDTDA